MSIPMLDLRRFDRDRTAFVAELGAAYEQWGFAGITHHELSEQVMDEAYRVFKAFFALPEEVKQRYHIAGSGGARGYTGFKVETAKDSSHPDLKEFWHVGREIPDQHRFRSIMPANLDVPEVPGFKDAAYALYEALDVLGGRVLRAMALHLGLAEDYFADKVDQGNSILRAIHYPPIPADQDAPNVRAGRHEDINFITLLIGASAEGLEILSRQGEWIPVTAIPGAIIVNVGDMLQRLTNQVFRSTTHRVVNPADPARRAQPRYSIPFFLHPNPDFLIQSLPGCVSAENPDQFPQPITAHDYLLERLREIRLI